MPGLGFGAVLDDLLPALDALLPEVELLAPEHELLAIGGEAVVEHRVEGTGDEDLPARGDQPLVGADPEEAVPSRVDLVRLPVDQLEIGETMTDEERGDGLDELGVALGGADVISALVLEIFADPAAHLADQDIDRMRVVQRQGPPQPVQHRLVYRALEFELTGRLGGRVAGRQRSLELGDAEM